MYSHSMNESFQGEILFKSWDSIVDGSSGLFDTATPIFSFDGTDVMNSPKW